jgi:hypothetical protein
VKHSTLALFVPLAAFVALPLVACEDGTDNQPVTAPDGGIDVSAPSPDGGAPAIDCPAPTSGPTKHQGDVQGEEHWTAEGSPHVIEYDVNVRNGAKLVIEPCAEVQIAEGKHIRVAYPGTPGTGSLVADGLPTKPITIRGLDGARWASIYVHAPGTASLKHVTLEGGGGGSFEHNATIDALGDSAMPADAILAIDNVTIRKSLGTGVWMQRGATFMEGSKELTITESGGAESPYPIEIEEHAMDRLPTGSYTGNLKDEILLRSTGNGIAGSGLVVDATLRDRGVPYHVGTSKTDNFTIGGAADEATATMTIEPGVVMKFEPGIAFRIQTFTSDKPANAVLRAIGTPDKPIVFTSAADAPKPGDWRGLWFGGVPMAANELDHVRIEYTGADCSCTLNTCSNITEHEGAVIFTQQPPSAFITNTVFKDGAGHGITHGFDGTLVNFRPTNTFENIAGCPQTLPRSPAAGSCPEPKPACDGL